MSATVRDERLDQLVALLSQLAAGDLSARGLPSADEDDIDAIVVGVNMLAEELEASQNELEQRVQDRTAEFERLNHDVMQLTELGNLLQACNDPPEAFAVIEHTMAVMFSGLSGALYLYNASRNLLELRSSWGASDQPNTVSPGECWALRRGQQHLVSADLPKLSCRHVADRTGDSICIPMAAHGQTNGILHLISDGPDSSGTQSLGQARQRLSVAVAEQTALSLANIELRETLRTQALHDPLTGLYNRRFVENWISREISRADHSGGSLGILMGDLDGFKLFNDTHGHDAGDRLLHAVAQEIRRELREGDVPCRYGGEEFLVLLPDINESDIESRADQLRRAVAATRIDYKGVALPGVTMSIGVALYPGHGTTATAVVKAADLALYAAKRAGRDRVVMATPVGGQPFDTPMSQP